MTREVRVLLVEDDFYARGWMEMLLRRDWRTKVVGEIAKTASLAAFLQELHELQVRVDLVLIDTDIPGNHGWLNETLPGLTKYIPNAKVVFSSVNANSQVARLLPRLNYCGYILKDEIRYALAWAVALAAEGHFVLTPGVCNLFGAANPLPAGSLILDGRNPIANFSRRDAEAARLAFMFSMERRDLADELEISEEYSYGLVSSLYEKMGLNDILKGEGDPVHFFGSHTAVQKHIKETIAAIRKIETGSALSGRNKPHKIRDKETLAFHLLTMPEIEEMG